MRKTIAALVLLGGAAHAGEPPPPPVCADPGVLRQVGDALRARGQPMVLDVPPVGEVSLSRPGASPSFGPPLAHCTARGHTLGYDTNRSGMTPIYEPFVVRYTIEMRHNGLFVQVD